MAQKKINGAACYFIRESYPEEGYFLSRDLIDLGPDPGRFIIYPGGNSFYIDEFIEDRIHKLGIKFDSDALEDIFWPFLRPEIRRALEPFRSREKRHQSNRRKRRPHEDPDARVHIFDKRRTHFLRFGDPDQRNLSRLPQRMFNLLHNKSRDEIEQMFMGMERELAVREFKTYAYVIFDLQHYFHGSVARNNPQMLDQNKVDDHFIEQVCRLNTDPVFWAGMPSGDGLNEYLVRYVLMYFDHDYAPGSLMDEYLRQFINSRRDYRPPNRNSTPTLKETSAIFGQTKEELKKMSRKELARQYRQKAQELHPDKGGDPDKFVKLTAAYHELLRTKQ
ncbi:MAG: J domain-containing protein [Desulfobacteraceae bacterium]|nr:J domain-containing protein [Desulfobacteraceae bacterium]